RHAVRVLEVETLLRAGVFDVDLNARSPQPVAEAVALRRAGDRQADMAKHPVLVVSRRDAGFKDQQMFAPQVVGPAQSLAAAERERRGQSKNLRVNSMSCRHIGGLVRDVIEADGHSLSRPSRPMFGSQT